jgi:16S rRNA (adenine1518-N6/adenine1519-N6)-dimethyltransferase
MTRPKKSLGQNFLIDQNIIDKIINTAEIEGNNIVEIGPGSGNLTKKIIEKKPNNLLLIEKDRDLFENLKKKFISSKNISIFNTPIQKISFNVSKRSCR